MPPKVILGSTKKNMNDNNVLVSFTGYVHLTNRFRLTRVHLNAPRIK